jgi:hypothetical protein
VDSTRLSVFDQYSTVDGLTEVSQGPFFRTWNETKKPSSIPSPALNKPTDQAYYDTDKEQKGWRNNRVDSSRESKGYSNWMSTRLVCPQGRD